MIARVLALILLALFGAPALAQVAIPPGEIGINWGGDPTVTPYPNSAGRIRVWGACYSGVCHAAEWEKINPSLGVFTYTGLDPLLNAAAAAHAPVNFTLGDIPIWVNSSQNISGPTQLGYLTTFVTNLMQHVAANGQCFGFFETWNEGFPGSRFWTGSDADMIALHKAVYPIVKSYCPNTVVLSDSILDPVDPNSIPYGSVPNPSSGWYHVYNLLNGCKQGVCWDAIAAHFYVEIVSMTNSVPSVIYQPESIADYVTQLQAVMRATGHNESVYFTEGYDGNDGIDATTQSWADDLALQVWFLASAGSPGVDPFSWLTGCSIQTECGNLHSTTDPSGLTPAGIGLRSIIGWMAGATVTSGPTRAAQTNTLPAALNGSGVAIGKLDGTGAGCLNPPTGTGSLPMGMSFTDFGAGSHGASHYVTGFGTTPQGYPYLRIRGCGTLNYSGTGLAYPELILASSGLIPTAQEGFTWQWALVDGSWQGLAGAWMQITETGSCASNTYQNVSALLPMPAATSDGQRYYIRFVPDSCATKISPMIVLPEQYNSSSPVAFDYTIEIAGVTRDSGTQWTIPITKSGGYQGTIAWDASGVGSITAPGGTTDFRDLGGGLHSATPGQTLPLTSGPILIEN